MLAGAHRPARGLDSSCSRRGSAAEALRRQHAQRQRTRLGGAARASAAAPAVPAPTDGATLQPAPPQPPPHAVISSLVGKRQQQLGPGHAVVPLLHPVQDRMPFAAALHVYSQREAATAATAPAPPRQQRAAGQQQQEQHQQDSGLVELSYVISGAGHFTSSAGAVMQQLRPGDSILARQGAAAFAAGPMPTAQQQQQQQQEQQQGAPPAWSGQLLSWLHQLTGNGDRRQQDSGAAPAGSSSSSSSARLVVLQLLLPSELLTGQLLAHHAGHYQAVAQHLPWAGAQEQQQQQQDSPSLVRDAAIARSIDEEEVCGFLADVAGAAAATPGHQQADGEQQQGAVQQQAVQQQEAHQHQQEQHDPQPTAPFASTRILKRARLSEVNAFRLPQQTNRLALLFGPTSSNPVAGTPALSLSFGVEVFEPSHVTPLHVHTTAHELFFVLAGRGEAVFGGGSSGGSDEDGQVAQQQRVRLTAGDVAVFAPGLRHGIDNANDADQLWCIQLMLPNEAFVEWVSGGELAGGIDLELAAAAASCG